MFVNCLEQFARLMESARRGESPGAEVEAHLSRCQECARFLEEQRSLSAGLARIARENAAARLPAGIEARIFAQVDSQLASRHVWRPLAAAAIAASLAIGVFLARGPAPRQPGRAGDAPFVEIPFVAPFAPYERARIERMDLPVAALIAAGFRVQTVDAAGTVKADVLVGQDGRLHAIRLIPEVNQ